MATSKTTASKQSNAKKAEDVSEFMNRLQHPLKPEIEAVRQIILGANDRIREEIKWNAPSFAVEDHFATFNLRAEKFVHVIFHTGAKVKQNNGEGIKIEDPSGLLEWIAKDRGAVKFHSMSDVTSKRAALEELVNQWIESMNAKGNTR